jgi:hypothetical protein
VRKEDALCVVVGSLFNDAFSVHDIDNRVISE